ncbi:MAG TPA: hypothetical protein PLJ21_12020 [Pseudobdellovibrionaceae bacterium]|nr:hypothetical protein [Pseudobdellovibrionaceae bacterium]
MYFQKYPQIAVLALLSLTVGCSSYPYKSSDAKAVKTSTEESKTLGVTNEAAKNMKAHNFAEIKFNRGSSVLSEKNKASLNVVIEQAQSSGRIDEVLVLSWADEEYPSKDLKTLSRPQRDLAAKRNKAIKNYINEAKDLDVDAYNMAERPNPIFKWLKTSDSTMKESFLAAGLPTTEDSSDVPSKASHSVVLVKLK